MIRYEKYCAAGALGAVLLLLVPANLPWLGILISLIDVALAAVILRRMKRKDFS